jgi:DNA-binding NarL/FixJ family response regulator
MNKTRVLIVDDHHLIRKGVGAILSEHEDWEVCGEASSGMEALAATAQLKPDIVIMDISMNGMNGLDATRRILENNPGTEILILSVHESDQLIREVLACGARGYVLKADASHDLLTALEAVREHRLFFTPSVGKIVLRGYLSGPSAGIPPEDDLAAQLSRREREVLRLVAEGKSNKEVATALHIAVKTVEAHRAHIMRKLEFHSICDLVRYAIRNNIIEC